MGPHTPCLPSPEGPPQEAPPGTAGTRVVYRLVAADPVAAYFDLLSTGSEELQQAAATSWARWEAVNSFFDTDEATLKRFKRLPKEMILLIPENKSMEAIAYEAERIQIQGVVVGQLRSYQ